MLNDPLVQKVRSMLLDHLSKTGYRIFLFGSRVTDHHHPYSDIDIGIEGPRRVPRELMVKMEEVLEESDLPVKVDIVDFSRVTPEFSQIAKKTMRQL